MKIVFVFAIVIIVGSCGQSKNSTSNQEDNTESIPETVIEDTIATINPEDVEDLLSSFVTPEDPATVFNFGPKDPTLNKLLSPEKFRLPQEMRSGWPHADWEYAKLYVFNFEDNRTKPPYKELKPDSEYRQVILLNDEQAKTSIELKHRAGPTLIHSKCPIVIRHAIVYFNKNDEVVAGIGICFECGEQLVFPEYFSAKNEPLWYEANAEPYYSVQDKLYPNYAHYYNEEEGIMNDSIWDPYFLQSEIIEKWKILFTQLGADQYPKN